MRTHRLRYRIPPAKQGRLSATGGEKQDTVTVYFFGPHPHTGRDARGKVNQDAKIPLLQQNYPLCTHQATCVKIGPVAPFLRAARKVWMRPCALRFAFVQSFSTNQSFVCVNCASTYVVEELAVLGRPADLHDARCHYQRLVVPDAGVHLKRTAHALKGRGVTPGLQHTAHRFSADEHLLTRHSSVLFFHCPWAQCVILAVIGRLYHLRRRT